MTKNAMTLTAAGVPARVATPLIDRYSDVLNGTAHWQRLIPLDQLEGVKAELDLLCRPASLRAAQAAAGMIVGLFPARQLEAPAVFVDGLVSELRAYPEVVLMDVVRLVRRRCRFLPSVAELIELCDEASIPLRRHRKALDRMPERHRQAAEMAERQAAADAELEREMRASGVLLPGEPFRRSVKA